ncbi:MAG TPA: phasin family protein [Salinibacter sp.]|nr:phasin family protein [Salinibacter sp.]
MTDQKKNKDQSRTDILQDELSKRGRDVWLAGLGALATVEEEGNKLFKRLVERGEQFEEERRQELQAAGEKAREQRDEALAQIEEASEETQSLLMDTVNTALERFGVPTRNEVDRLSKKVETLSEQVDTLSKTLSKRKAKANGKK